MLDCVSAEEGIHHKQKRVSSWCRGWGSALPWGIVGGLLSILPLVLSKRGASLDLIARSEAMVRIPILASFLAAPLLDSKWTRGRYSLVTLVSAALLTGVGFFHLTSGHQATALWLIMAAIFSVGLYDNASSGWIAQFTAQGDTGRVGAWEVFFELAGNLALTYLAVKALGNWSIPPWIMAAGLSVGVLATLFPLSRFPNAGKPLFNFRTIFNELPKDVWRALQRRDCWFGLLLFALPLGTSAASNLQSALGKDFHTSEGAVVWANGIGSNLACFVGMPIGGMITHRLKDKLSLAYLFFTVAISIISVLTGVLPLTPACYVASLLLNGLVWACQATAANALILSLVRRSPVAATQRSLLVCAFYLSQSYMSLVDGAVYRHGGVRALFLADGLPGLVLLLPLFYLLHSRKVRQFTHEPENA